MNMRVKIIQALALFLLLVVLPIGSWYYLRSGYQYRKASLQELQDLGKLAAFSALSASGDTVSLESWRGKVVVGAFLPEQKSDRDYVLQQLDKLHQQFDAREDILFVAHFPADQPLDTNGLSSMDILNDSTQWVLLPVEPARFQALGKESFRLTTEDGLLATDHLSLSDTSLTVRRLYDLRDNRDMGRLIEHITIVMPRLPEKDVLIRREKEK